MKRRLVAGLMALTLALTPRLAYAHAGLRDADPAPGSAVVGSPSEIRLTFDEALAAGSAFVVYAAAFQAVPGITPMIEGASLRAIPAAPLPSGAYTVQWKAVTDDGGVTEGSYQFRVVSSAGIPIWPWAAGLVFVLAGSAVVMRRLWRGRANPAGTARR